MIYRTACLSTAYLPPVSYFAKLYHYPVIEIETHSHYVKQTYRNRCHIAGANGIMPLSIPVIKPQQVKCADGDIRISDHDNWQHLHWNTIVSAYGSTPFFEYYRDDLFPCYQKNQNGRLLLDFNNELLHIVCDWLDIHPQIRFTSHYKTEFAAEERDFRETIHPKHSGNHDFIVQEYYQVFAGKHGFIPDMSIIDLVFNMGPESILILNGAEKTAVTP